MDKKKISQLVCILEIHLSTNTFKHRTYQNLHATWNFTCQPTSILNLHEPLPTIAERPWSKRQLRQKNYQIDRLKTDFDSLERRLRISNESNATISTDYKH